MKEVKAQIKTKGMELLIPFEVPGGEAKYQLRCPLCEGVHFLMSMDYTRIACSNIDCLAVVLTRGQPVAIHGKGGVGWKL